MAYTDLNAIKTALETSSWDCLKKSLHDLESQTRGITTLIQTPEFNTEAISDGLTQWKAVAAHLTWNLTDHSLLLHDDTPRSCMVNTVVSYWKAIQVLIVQFEKLPLQHNEKHSEEARWLQIQGFVELLVALLKRFKREQCAMDDFSAEKRKPDGNEPRILKLLLIRTQFTGQ